MIPDIGHFALSLALVLSMVQFMSLFLPRDVSSVLSAKMATTAFFFCLLSFVALVWSFIVSDFSVMNVVQNSHTEKPLLYKISGTWGNHEGSMLLWITMLTFVGALYGNSSRMIPNTLAVHGAIVAMFSAFTLFTSNPFTRIFPSTLQGLDLNPLLQHPALAIHPPLLYLGYVGLGLVFAITCAALIQKTEAGIWAANVRPWVMFSWTALGAGTALGAWWAYAELGWGGWWFWDPVENAALMPWLTATALIHSVITVQKREILTQWSLFLALLSFVLVVMGFFLVRSGLLTSVHSFANSPDRGLFILAILGIIGGTGFALFLARGPQLNHTSSPDFQIISREGSLLMASAFLFSSFATVFIGTLYPLLLEALDLPAISVGPPFFNRTFIPILLPALMAIPIAPYLAWKKGSIKKAFGIVSLACVFALAGGFLAMYLVNNAPVLSFIGVFCGLWIMMGGAFPFFRYVVEQKTWRVPLSTLALSLAHGGVGLAILAISGSALWETESIRPMPIGKHQEFKNGTVILDDVYPDQGRNFIDTKGRIIFNDRVVVTPSRRNYTSQDTRTSEAGITTRLFADWFANLGEPLDENKKTYAVHLRHIPMMLWLWISFILITVGGIMANIKIIRKNRKAR